LFVVESRGACVGRSHPPYLALGSAAISDVVSHSTCQEACQEENARKRPQELPKKNADAKAREGLEPEAASEGSSRVACVRTGAHYDLDDSVIYIAC
jgi:hypothetical protein